MPNTHSTMTRIVAMPVISPMTNFSRIHPQIPRTRIAIRRVRNGVRGDSASFTPLIVEAFQVRVARFLAHAARVVVELQPREAVAADLRVALLARGREGGEAGQGGVGGGGAGLP